MIELSTFLQSLSFAKHPFLSGSSHRVRLIGFRVAADAGGAFRLSPPAG
jgi:hypothetical protein